MTALLVLHALVFAAWAVTAFTLLFRIRRGMANPWPGPRATLAAFARAVRDPAFATLRRRLLALTLALLALSVLSARLGP
jgi:hypothetical protein